MPPVSSKRAFLVTGGTGFLGSHLVRELVSRGDEVVLLKRVSSDISRLGPFFGKCRSYNLGEIRLETLFEHYQFDMILHCATHYGRAETSPIPVVEANLLLPLSLLHLAIAKGVRRFINTDTILDPRQNHYSTSKKQFLEWFKNYAAQLACINVALEHFYGPGDDPSKFVSNIIWKFLRNEKSIALTPGEQRRDFIYIDDVVDGFLKIIDWSFAQQDGFHHFEIGSGQTISIRRFVETLQQLTGNTETRLEFGALPYRPAEIMESKVDLKPLSNLGYSPRVSLQEGLGKTIAFERARRS